MSRSKSSRSRYHEGPIPCEGALPCPFCGEIPLVQPWHGGGKRKRMISCEGEYCDVRPSVTGSDRRRALEKWNRRHFAYPAPIPEFVRVLFVINQDVSFAPALDVRATHMGRVLAIEVTKEMLERVAEDVKKGTTRIVHRARPIEDLPSIHTDHNDSKESGLPIVAQEPERDPEDETDPDLDSSCGE